MAAALLVFLSGTTPLLQAEEAPAAEPWGAKAYDAAIRTIFTRYQE